MEKGEEITMADVQAALKKQGMEGFEFAEGDAIIFRTGSLSPTILPWPDARCNCPSITSVL